MGFALIYIAGVLGSSLAIRWGAKSSGRAYDPEMAAVACALWPLTATIILAMVLSRFLTWALRLTGKP